MHVASDPHPTHTNYPAFNSGGSVSSWTFTFTLAGSWGYHNHQNSGHTGTIVVTN
jgi:hypothetical protein